MRLLSDSGVDEAAIAELGDTLLESINPAAPCLSAMTTSEDKKELQE